MLYSKTLGAIAIADNGVNHTIYTVPVGQGPAVVRSISIYAQPGCVVLLWAQDPSGSAYALATADNASGTQPLAMTVQLYQPLDTSWELHAEQSAGISYWSAICGGYQFSTP